MTELRRKFGVMKRSMWMICNESSSSKLHILVANIYVNDSLTKFSVLRGIVKEAQSYLLHQWRFWAVMLIRNLPEPCVSILYI
jgi:hypothetical protein